MKLLWDSLQQWLLQMKLHLWLGPDVNATFFFCHLSSLLNIRILLCPEEPVRHRKLKQWVYNFSTLSMPASHSSILLGSNRNKGEKCIWTTELYRISTMSIVTCLPMGQTLVIAEVSMLFCIGLRQCWWEHLPYQNAAMQRETPKKCVLT